MEQVSLFERLGGSSGIKALVDDLVALHMENPAINARFLPYVHTPERIDAIKAQVRAFLEAGSGGGTQYTGRSMTEVHRGMNVSEAEYLATMDDMMAACRKQNLDEQTQRDVLAIAFSLKGEILHA